MKWNRFPGLQFISWFKINRIFVNRPCCGFLHSPGDIDMSSRRRSWWLKGWTEEDYGNCNWSEVFRIPVGNSNAILLELEGRHLISSTQSLIAKDLCNSCESNQATP